MNQYNMTILRVHILRVLCGACSVFSDVTSIFVQLKCFGLNLAFGAQERVHPFAARGLQAG